MSKMIIPM